MFYFLKLVTPNSNYGHSKLATEKLQSTKVMLDYSPYMYRDHYMVSSSHQDNLNKLVQMYQEHNTLQIWEIGTIKQEVRQEVTIHRKWFRTLPSRCVKQSHWLKSFWPSLCRLWVCGCVKSGPCLQKLYGTSCECVRVWVCGCVSVWGRILTEVMCTHSLNHHLSISSSWFSNSRWHCEGVSVRMCECDSVWECECVWGCMSVCMCVSELTS